MKKSEQSSENQFDNNNKKTDMFSKLLYDQNMTGVQQIVQPQLNLQQTTPNTQTSPVAVVSNDEVLTIMQQRSAIEAITKNSLNFNISDILNAGNSNNVIQNFQNYQVSRLQPVLTTNQFTVPVKPINSVAPRFETVQKQSSSNTSNSTSTTSSSNVSSYPTQFVTILKRMLEPATASQFRTADLKHPLFSWSENGSSIMIRNSRTLFPKMMASFFSTTDINSFIRQLNHYGFAKIKRVEDQNLKGRLDQDKTLEFQHPEFRKDNLCNLKRRKRNENAVRNQAKNNDSGRPASPKNPKLSEFKNNKDYSFQNRSFSANNIQNLQLSDISESSENKQLKKEVDNLNQTVDKLKDELKMVWNCLATQNEQIQQLISKIQTTENQQLSKKTEEQPQQTVSVERQSSNQTEFSDVQD